MNVSCWLALLLYRYSIEIHFEVYKYVIFPYRTVYIIPLWGGFQARLLDNQEGANAERYVFGKLSVRRFQRRPVLAPVLLEPLLWRYRPWEVGPGGVILRRRIR